MTVIKNHLADGFVRALPGEVRAILVYGPDAGLVSERAKVAVASFTGGTDDPFALARLSQDDIRADPARLADEALSIALFGGRRAVWARPGEADITPALHTLEGRIGDDMLLVVEAGDLRPAAPLRKLFEKAPHWAAIPCYSDSERDLERLIEAMLGGAGLAIDRDARAHLLRHLGGDRLATRLELEKLALYAGTSGRVSLDDIRAVCGDASAFDLDELFDAAGQGDAAAADSATQRLLQAGSAPAEIVSGAMRHFMQLHELRTAIEAGQPPAAAIATARPPVFFKRKDAMIRQCTLWNTARLNRALDILHEAERQSRLMASIDLAPHCVGRALLAVAVLARAGGGAGGRG